MLREAMLYNSGPEGRLVCNACENRCELCHGQVGVCGVRENRDGRLYSLTYGAAAVVQVSEIEKRFVYHFLPGSRTLSLATVGCNFRCAFCVNWDISQGPKLGRGRIDGERLSPEQAVALALRNECSSIMYGHSEPTVFLEYVYDIASVASEVRLANILMTNGYMTEDALWTLSPLLQAVNIVLYSLEDRFYRQFVGGTVGPVLRNVRLLRRLGVWVEVTTLVIPSLNDNDECLRDVAQFIAGVGPDMPWHLVQFHPDYQMGEWPFTPASTLRRAREIGRAEGLRYVYASDLPEEELSATRCASCDTLLLRRSGHELTECRLKAGACPDCGTPLDGLRLSHVSPAVAKGGRNCA